MVFLIDDPFTSQSQPLCARFSVPGLQRPRSALQFLFSSVTVFPSPGFLFPSYPFAELQHCHFLLFQLPSSSFLDFNLPTLLFFGFWSQFSVPVGLCHFNFLVPSFFPSLEISAHNLTALSLLCCWFSGVSFFFQFPLCHIFVSLSSPISSLSNPCNFQYPHAQLP